MSRHFGDDDRPVRDMRYSCSDRMCGAYDCERCRPGCSQFRACDDCGKDDRGTEQRSTLKKGEPRYLCDECWSMHTCEECGEDDRDVVLVERVGARPICEDCRREAMIEEDPKRDNEMFDAMDREETGR